MMSNLKIYSTKTFSGIRTLYVHSVSILKKKKIKCEFNISKIEFCENIYIVKRNNLYVFIL